METNQQPTAITQEPTAITKEPTAITPPLVSKQILPVSKTQPQTITKNPARVAAGQRTAEMMKQRKATVLERNAQNNTNSTLTEPWLSYALGGMVIVAVVLYFNKKNVPVPKVEIVQQSKQSNSFQME